MQIFCNKIQFIFFILIVSECVFWYLILFFYFWYYVFQRSGEFIVCFSDVLLIWKYLLYEKLNLLVENMVVIDYYEDIRRIYEDFLKNSNMLDLIDVY